MVHVQSETPPTTSHAQDLSTDYSLAVDISSPKSLVQRRSPCAISPASSPHKLGKVGPKRRRTVAIRKLSSALSFSEVRENPTPVRPTQQTLTVQAFQESIGETQQRENMQLKFFSYALQKYVADQYERSSEKHVLKGVRQFLTQAQSCDEQPSQVYYMEVVDENPDNDETMAQVADDLLDKFSTTPEAWVVLVGDGKTPHEHKASVWSCSQQTANIPRRLAHT